MKTKKAINDSELEMKNENEYDDVQGLIADMAAPTVAIATNNSEGELIYSTPSNKLIDRSSDDNRSVLHLVQHDNNETLA